MLLVVVAILLVYTNIRNLPSRIPELCKKPLLKADLEITLEIEVNFKMFMSRIQRYAIRFSQEIRTIPISTDNKISVPHKSTRVVMTMMERLRRHKDEHFKKHNPTDPPLHQQGCKPVLKSSIKRLNHYAGQKYPYVDTRFLVSHGWKNSKSNGQRFLINYNEQNPTKFFSGDGLSSLPAFLTKSLHRLDIQELTELQMDVISYCRSDNQHLLCVSHTGSGKTLAYLLPIIEKCLKYKQIALVIAPTFALCNQITNVCNDLLQDCVDISCLNLLTVEECQLNSSLSTKILISTPRNILNMKGILSSSNFPIRFIVLDESDTLLDNTFIEDTTDVVRTYGIGVSDEIPWTRLMFISATITPHLRKQIELFVKLPQLKQFESKHVNVVMPHVPQIFMRIGKSHKPGKLLEKVKIDNKRCILVFCNDCRTTCWLSNFLKANGVRSGYINSNLSPKEREQVLLDFNNGVIQCLCATDAMSKGIDTQWVDNVINYDFPVDIKDYIHRAGRVGRLSPKQMDILVTNFISCKKEAGTAQRIEMSVRGMSNLSESIDELSLND